MNNYRVKRGPFFWICIILMGFLFLGLCCCGSSTFLLSIINPDSSEQSFSGFYCEHLKKEESLSSDNLGLCE